MRCPKCGYISFDNQETCRKCNKNIGEIVAEVNGTICDAASPAFLHIETKRPFPVQPPPLQQPTDLDIDLDDSEPEEALREGIDTDFVFDEKEISLTDDSEKLVMELDEFSQVSPQEEFTLNFEEDHGEEDKGGTEKELPPLDFGDLDISDLAPPAKEQSGNLVFDEELTLTSTEPVAALSEYAPPPPKPPAPKSAGLEDLNMNGLNLDSSPKLVADSAPTGKRHIPSVKTGTALDNFDVDLGEIFTQNKK